MNANFKSLTWKQTNLVVFAALFFAFAIYLIEITMVVISARSLLTASQNELLDYVEQPAANAVWALDEKLAKQTLEGILKVEHIASVVIKLDDDTEFVSVTGPIAPANIFAAISDDLFDEYKEISRPLYRPYNFNHSDDKQLIGTLSIQYDMQDLTNTLIKQLKLSLFATLARALLITLALSVIFHRFLTRPIAQISNSIDKINPELPDEHLLPVTKAHIDDELGLVTTKLNQILIKFSQAQNKLRKMATRDPLTGLPNRTLLLEAINSSITRARREKHQFSLLFIDLDRFKNINDSLGHALGDQYLMSIANVLEKYVGDRGTVARLGGDEFVILADDVKTIFKTTNFVNGLLLQLNAPLILNDHTLHPAASIGVAIYPDDGINPENLIRHADIAMYSAKAEGSNQWAFFKQQMTEKVSTRLKTEASLYSALENEEFLLHYQPKFDIKTGEILSCEALIRWQKDQKLVRPDLFIPIAEDTGIIIPIGRWVIEQACKTLKMWQQEFNRVIPIAVNVSPQQFNDPSLIPDIKQLTIKYDIDPSLIELEVTETSLMNNIELAINRLQKLKSAGFGIAIDDFGTGYSSLSYLKKLPITTLKIDRCFVNDLPNENAIASTVLMLGQQLGLNIVAEGIETMEQLNWLKQNNCQIGQGFYYSKPLTQEQFESTYFLAQSKEINNTL